MIRFVPVMVCDGCGRQLVDGEAFAEDVEYYVNDYAVHVGVCRECQARGLALEIHRDSGTGQLSAWVISPHLHPAGAQS